MHPFGHIAFTNETLTVPEGSLRAALVTSLGFGHVSALLMILHPAAFEAMLDDDQRDGWRAKVAARGAASRARREAIWTGAQPAYERRTERRFVAADGSAEQAAEETQMLLDPNARLGETAFESNGAAQ